jgi:hypothetical protein
MDARGLEGLHRAHGRHNGKAAVYPNSGEHPTLSHANILAGLPHDLLAFHDAELDSFAVPG